MDMDQASVFLAGSILTCLGFIVVAIAILVVNNLVAKYWKPITILRFEDVPPPRFVEAQESTPPNTAHKSTTTD